jgi:carbon monoxide dehydrogenase subunit G
MQLEHSFTVPVGIDDAWKTLLDIEQVAPCMPGAALETVDGDSFTGLVKVKLGPISLTYKGKASFIEKDEAAHRATIDAQGKDSRGNGTAAAKVTATLTSAGATTTKVDVLTDLNITGKPAQFGRGVMVDVGNKLIGQFADNLSAQLSESSSAAPAAEAPAPAKRAPAKAATTTAAATATKATVTAAAKAAPAKAAAPTKAAPAKAAPAAPVEAPAETPAAAPAAPAAAAPRIIASREVEPIDLMASAGPAVAKRVIPLVAVVAVVLAVLFARRRRR